MPYFVKRGEQKFGPYTLAELQRYLQSGNLTTSDLAQNEGMEQWVPITQVLGNIPVESVSSSGAAAAPAPEVQHVALPPNWHWAIVLILGGITRGFFNLVWAVIQANWARKLINDNKPMVLVSMYPTAIITGSLILVLMRNSAFAGIGGFLIFGGLIVYIVGMFSIKNAMEEYYNSTENIGLKLSGPMTFFFSTVYIQYQINSLARWKKTGVLS